MEKTAADIYECPECGHRKTETELKYERADYSCRCGKTRSSNYEPVAYKKDIEDIDEAAKNSQFGTHTITPGLAS